MRKRIPSRRRGGVFLGIMGEEAAGLGVPVWGPPPWLLPGGAAVRDEWKGAPMGTRPCWSRNGWPAWSGQGRPGCRVLRVPPWVLQEEPWGNSQRIILGDRQLSDTGRRQHQPWASRRLDPSSPVPSCIMILFKVLYCKIKNVFLFLFVFKDFYFFDVGHFKIIY